LKIGLQKLLFELIKNSKRSDRDLAKTLGVSQPTITRMRKKLEQKMISEYTVIPNWEELGYEIMALTFVGVKPTYQKEAEARKVEKWMMNQPNVVFAADGQGMGMSAVVISFHRNYTDFLKFLTETRTEWAEYLTDIQTFIVTVKGGLVFKPFSLKYLASAKEN